jgi:hypothetical protein
MQRIATDPGSLAAIDQIIAAVQTNREIRRHRFLEGRAPLVRIRKNGTALQGHGRYRCVLHVDADDCPYECSVDDEPACPECAIARVASGEYAIDVDSFANVIGRWVLEGSYP